MKQKILYLLIILLTGILRVNAQTDSVMDQVLKNLATTLNSDNVQGVKAGLIKDTTLYNMIWNDLINSSALKKWHFLKDINVQFKTFQGADSNSTSLGLSYSFNYSYGKSTQKMNVKQFQDFGLTASGNVAYKKAANPANLLETNIHYDYLHYKGGTLKTKDGAFFTEENRLEDSLTNIDDMNSKEAIQLWKQFGEGLVFSNEYFYGLSPSFGFETNQDFSRVQATPGVLLTLGAKAWNDQNPLAKCNIFDYPFALLRLLFGTDKAFTPYGSVIPTIQFGFNYIKPTNDTIREKVQGNLNAYPRFKFETGFKSLVSTIDKQNVYFDCDFRFYQEIDPSAAIKKAKLDQQTYFVMALETASGFYVSYSTGQLPFDVKSDQVYSLGFNYKF
jgi:hypothetical protein